MSGDIYFGIDMSLPSGLNDGYVNTATFEAFGDLIRDALSNKYKTELEIIVEGEPMSIYSFVELSSIDYNNVIKQIRMHIASMIEPTPWQQKGVWVWMEMAEPFIRKDARYDFTFHGEAPPVP